MSDFVLTPKREKELEKIAKDLPDSSFKKLYGKGLSVPIIWYMRNTGL